MGFTQISAQQRERLAAWNSESAQPAAILEQVPMLHGDMINHIFGNLIRADRARRGVGLEGVLLLEVRAEGGDVVVLVAVGARELGHGRRLLVHVQLLHPRTPIGVAELRGVEALGGGQARDPVLRVHAGPSLRRRARLDR